MSKFDKEIRKRIVDGFVFANIKIVIFAACVLMVFNWLTK